MDSLGGSDRSLFSPASIRKSHQDRIATYGWDRAVDEAFRCSCGSFCTRSSFVSGSAMCGQDLDVVLCCAVSFLVVGFRSLSYVVQSEIEISAPRGLFVFC